MSPVSKREYVHAVTQRYQQAPRAETSRILDELCAICGYHRKHAIATLRAASRPRRPRRKPGRPRMLPVRSASRPGSRAGWGPINRRSGIGRWRSVTPCSASRRRRSIGSDDRSGAARDGRAWQPRSPAASCGTTARWAPPSGSRRGPASSRPIPSPPAGHRWPGCSSTPST